MIVDFPLKHFILRNINNSYGFFDLFIFTKLPELNILFSDLFTDIMNNKWPTRDE